MRNKVWNGSHWEKYRIFENKDEKWYAYLQAPDYIPAKDNGTISQTFTKREEYLQKRKKRSTRIHKCSDCIHYHKHKGSTIVTCQLPYAKFKDMQSAIDCMYYKFRRVPSCNR